MRDFEYDKLVVSVSRATSFAIESAARSRQALAAPKVLRSREFAMSQHRLHYLMSREGQCPCVHSQP